MNVEPETYRARFIAERAVRLATTGPDGPHVVPMVFAVEQVAAGSSGDVIVSMVDHKPKRSRALRRLDNLSTEPRAALLADRYDEDWSRLWWVRADCVAEVTDDPVRVGNAAALLAERYPQYIGNPPEGPLIRFTVVRWSGWSVEPDTAPTTATRTPDVTLDAIEKAGIDTERMLRDAGHSQAADQLRSALEADGVGGAEYLLVLREALVATRPAWSTLDEPIPQRLSRTLGAAKRLAASGD